MSLIRNKIRKHKTLTTILAFIAISLIVLKYDNKQFTLTLVSWGLVGLMGFALCIFFAKKSKSNRAKLFLAYVSVLPLCLFIGEFYAFFYLKYADKKAKSSECETISEGSYNQSQSKNDILGYKSNVKNDTIISHRILKESNKTIYNATYTNDKNGWRATPNSNLDSTKCFLLFGDSFTYGEGINDNETLAFYISKATGQKYRIYNFGFHGYGAHQALALLKSGEVQKVLSKDKKCDEIIALYESLPTHIARTSGFSAWEKGNKNAPRFSIENGKVVWINSPQNLVQDSSKYSHKKKRDFKTRLNDSLKSRKEKSYLYQLFYKPNKYAYKEQYNELFFAVLEEMRAELRAQFGSDLVFLLWDSNNLSKELEIQESSAIIKWLKSNDMRYFLISQMIDDYKQNRLKYGIHACDTHPNALANEKIAEFLADKIKNGEIKSHKVKSTQQESTILTKGGKK